MSPFNRADGRPKRRSRTHTKRRVCDAPGCEAVLVYAPYCPYHRTRLQRYGTLEPERIVGDDLTRFMSKVNTNGFDCWTWTARTDADGYGVFRLVTGWVRAHRWAYENFTGQRIPNGMVIDHLCRNRSCVNPLHFEVVTPVENNRRAVRTLRTHCKHGHEFTSENTAIKNGHRECRECNRIRNREWNAKYGAEYQRRRATAKKAGA